ncbi:MAG: hypothetical protein DRN66_01950 [Candidatus Nanohalarchaeota archaeon]|nr:MAG: hypothetical protein DRN66_01950 [Candidatus Nanohaloarchaeota archaeon]
MFGIHKKYLESFKSYILGIKKGDNIAIMYHTDCDGICSCLIIKKTIAHLLGKDSFIFTQKQGKIAVIPATVELLKKKKITKFIAVDMAVDEDEEPIREIEKFADILIIDHHIKKADLSSGKTVFIKAQDYESSIDSSKYPASKLCFDLATPMIEGGGSRRLINDLKFISSIGISGDAGYDFWAQKKFLAKNDKEKIQKIDHIISSYISIKGKFNSIVRILEEDNIEQKINKRIVENKDISQYYFDIQKELERLILEIDHKARFLKDRKGNIKLVFYSIQSRYNIKSILANKISFEDFPTSTVVVEKNGGFSARNQTFKISMNDMVKTATKGIEGAGGGGHIPAAGGYVPKENVEEFFKNVVEYIERRV